MFQAHSLILKVTQSKYSFMCNKFFFQNVRSLCTFMMMYQIPVISYVRVGNQLKLDPTVFRCDRIQESKRRDRLALAKAKSVVQ